MSSFDDDAVGSLSRPEQNSAGGSPVISSTHRWDEFGRFVFDPLAGAQPAAPPPAALARRRPSLAAAAAAGPAPPVRRFGTDLTAAATAASPASAAAALARVDDGFGAGFEDFRLGARGGWELDDMSYEALSELENVQVGLRQDQIERLPVRVFREDERNGARKCAVCLVPFAPGDRLRILPCMDQFHSACVDPWLRHHKTCPIDKSAVQIL